MILINSHYKAVEKQNSVHILFSEQPLRIPVV